MPTETPLLPGQTRLNREKRAKRREVVPEVVKRYLAGETIMEISQGSPVAWRTLYRWVIDELGEEKWREIQTRLLLSRVADADVALATAKGPDEVRKAIEMAKFARFDLERRRPKLYGSRQEQDKGRKVIVYVNRGGREEQVRLPEAGQIIDVLQEG